MILPAHIAASSLHEWSFAIGAIIGLAIGYLAGRYFDRGSA